jgi:hypothetical protein
MILRLVLLLTVLFIFISNVGLCEIYKWKSDDGRINFTDNLGKVPEKYRDQVERKKYRSTYKTDENVSIENRENSNEKSVAEESITEYEEEPKKELSDEEKEKID